METEIKPFLDIQLSNRYIKVFIASDIDEKTAKKALDSFIEKFENNELKTLTKNDPIDFLIINKDGVTCSHKADNNQEPHCVWLKNVQLETVKTIGVDSALNKYKIKIPTNFYGILPIENNIEDGKEN